MLCELNRVGDPVWPGKPQATEPQHVADQVTTVAVPPRPDLINGYLFLFSMCCGARRACTPCDGFRFARNTPTTFDVFFWQQVTNFDVSLFIRRQTDCITLILMFLFSASIADYFVTVFVLGCQRRRKRFAVRADEKLTTLVDLEAAIAARQI